jgi:hypothetical protein
MGKLKRTVKVQEIEGEPMRFRVESWEDPRLYHVVDLSERGGAGECDCRDFTTTCTRNWKDNGGKWVHYGFPGQPDPERVMCRHIYCARVKFTDTTLRAIAAKLHPQKEPT